MDESLVDIVLILLAALVAVTIIPEFEVELPLSREVEEGSILLDPLQIMIDHGGAFYHRDESSDTERRLGVQQLYSLVVATAPHQAVEIHADAAAPAIYLLEAHRVINQAGRNAVFLVNTTDL